MGFNVQNSTDSLTFLRMFCINRLFCLFSLLSCRKRKYGKQHEEDRSYTKKPPNAFMLFMMEQRSKVEPELRKKGSAVVNTVLGQRVSVLYVWDSQCYKLDQTVVLCQHVCACVCVCVLTDSMLSSVHSGSHWLRSSRPNITARLSKKGFFTNSCTLDGPTLRTM